MKRRISWIIVIMVAQLAVSSCTKESAPGIVNNVTPIVTRGEWRVTLYSERGTDETADFTGYSFSFQSDGKLVVQKGGAIVKQGLWSEDNSSGKLIINLGIKDNSNKPFGGLTDDWILTAKSDTNIKLTDDKVARNELLEFTKN